MKNDESSVGGVKSGFKITIFSLSRLRRTRILLQIDGVEEEVISIVTLLLLLLLSVTSKLSFLRCPATKDPSSGTEELKSKVLATSLMLMMSEEEDDDC